MSTLDSPYPIEIVSPYPTSKIDRHLQLFEAAQNIEELVVGCPNCGGPIGRTFTYDYELCIMTTQKRCLKCNPPEYVPREDPQPTPRREPTMRTFHEDSKVDYAKIEQLEQELDL